jgi:arylsulfatase A-like enzyme
MSATENSLPCLDGHARFARLLRRLLIAGLLVSSVARSDTKPECPGCNVLLITIDTLRPDRMALYGYAGGTSAGIGRYFDAKSVFTSAWSTAPCTYPSIAQLLSGSINSVRPRLAQVMREAGYSTSAIVSQGHFRNRKFGYREGFDHFSVQRKELADAHGLSTRTAEEVTELAIRRMDRWLERRTQAQPFFQWFHYFDPHDPYAPPREFRANQSKESFVRLSQGDRRQMEREALARGIPANRVFTDTQRRHFNSLYDSEVAYVDREVGRLLDAFEARGLLKNTMVILTSDHGEWLGEQHRWDHCQTLEWIETKVPLAVRVPGWTPDEKTRTGPVSTLDVMPTILAFAGIAPPEPKPLGTSLFETVASRSAVAVRKNAGFIRQGKWLLKCDLESSDAGEPSRCRPTSLERGTGENLLESEPARRDELVRKFAEMVDSPTAKGITEQAEKELRAIGYID